MTCARRHYKPNEFRAKLARKCHLVDRDSFPVLLSHRRLLRYIRVTSSRERVARAVSQRCTELSRRDTLIEKASPRPKWRREQIRETCSCIARKEACAPNAQRIYNTIITTAIIIRRTQPTVRRPPETVSVDKTTRPSTKPMRAAQKITLFVRKRENIAPGDRPLQLSSRAMINRKDSTSTAAADRE